MTCTKIASAGDRSHTSQTAANTCTNKSAGDRSPTHQIAADTAHTHANTMSADDRSLTPTIATTAATEAATPTTDNKCTIGSQGSCTGMIW